MADALDGDHGRQVGVIGVTLNGTRLQGRGLSPFGLPMFFSPVQIILLELFMARAASATFVVEPA